MFNCYRARLKLSLLFSSFLVLFSLIYTKDSYAIKINDNGQISEIEVATVLKIKSTTDIVSAIKRANTEGKQIAIMGVQHSQGGQSLLHNAIELDMRPFSKLLNLDKEKKQVTVQSGMIWSVLQAQINPFQLAVKSMQSPNIFTIGGSMSVNAHGDDFRTGSVANSVVGFHLILANGKTLYITKEKQPKLWASTLGGYGLTGVILDVTLQLTDNQFLQSSYALTTLNELPSIFQQKIFNNEKNVLFYAHLNIVPNKDFLRTMYMITYQNTNELPQKIIPLENPEKWNALLVPTFNFSRKTLLGKDIRHYMEEKVFAKFYNKRYVTRNNAMEKPVRFASDYKQPGKVDWLQEYFIPIEHLPKFIETLRTILLENHVNLLNVTIRYVPKEPSLTLSYATFDSFAVVLYFQQNLTKEEVNHTKRWTQRLIQAALTEGGHYYLPYQGFATIEQFHQSYPGYKTLLATKKKYDPKNLFSNRFAQEYLGL